MADDLGFINAYAGETQVGLLLTIDPYFYHSNAHNNFSFFCEYIAPSGNVNLVFPDSPCAAFDILEGRTGEYGFLQELLVADLYQFWAGSTADANLSTYCLLGTSDAYTGENSVLGLSLSAIFPLTGYSGANSDASLTIPPRAELSGDAYTGETTDWSLSTTLSLPLDAYSGSNGIASLTLFLYADYIKSEGPSAYWKLDETFGTSAADYSGNNWTGTYVGVDKNFDTTVASKKAVYLDGSDTITSSFLLSTTSGFTQEFWVKPDATIPLSTPSGSGNAGLGSTHKYVTSPYTPSGGMAAIEVGSNGIQISSRIGNNYPVILSYQQSISITQFTHILVSWTNRYPSLYVNGVLVATGAFQADSPVNAYGLPQTTTYGAYKGYLQDAAVYPSALTAEQAREHYLAGIGLHFIPRLEPVQAYTGENIVPIDFITDPNINLETANAYDGGRGTLDLQNNVRFTIDATSGELAHIYENSLNVIPNSTFTYFYGGNTHSETSTCLTLQSRQQSSSGINAGFYLPASLNLQSISQINVRFKRTRPASWYDDDFSDAMLQLWFFPNWLTSEILYDGSTWNYQRPKEDATGNAQALCISLRYATNAAIKVFWFETSTVIRTENLTVLSNFTTSEVDGTDPIRFNITTNANNTSFTVYGGDDRTVRQTGTFASMPNVWSNSRSTTNDIFLIHYHNYTPSRSEVICNLSVYEYEGLLLTVAQSLGLIQAVTGQTADAVLHTTVVLDPIGYSGEIGDVNVSYFQSASIGILTGYSGERSDLALSTFGLMILDARSGEVNYIDLTTNPFAQLISDARSGETASAVLSTVTAIEVIAYSGSRGTLDLDIHPASFLTAIAYSGSRGDLDLKLGVTLPITAYTGASGAFDLTYIVNLGMPATIYSGEQALLLDIAPTYNLPLYARPGSFGYFELATEYKIDLEGRSGEVGYAILTLNLPDLFDGTGYSGQYVQSFVLSTTTTLAGKGYTGQVLIPTLTDNPAAPFDLPNYTGATASAVLQVGFQFAVSRNYTGAVVTVTGIDTEPNIYVPSGAYCEFTLATTNALPLTAYDGATGIGDLTRRPSEPFGIFSFISGEWASPGLEALYSVSLHVLFRASIITQLDIGSATYFDLASDLCCGPRPQTNNLNFALERGQIPEAVSYGNGVGMEVDLLTNSRFKVEFVTGTVAELVDKSAYFTFTMAHESHQVELLWEEDLRHKLCKGHFIPTGDWVVVELQDVLPENCYTDRMYGGETLTCVLSDDIVLQFDPIPTGEYFNPIDLGTIETWLLYARSGENFYWDRFELGRYYVGETMSFKFYDQPLLAFGGQSASFEISLEYGVRFKEDGCFDNEFVFQTPSGDAIPEMFNPVPVEGEPFTHSVKAECF